jgi:AcrR family transcriptional regulator
MSNTEISTDLKTRILDASKKLFHDKGFFETKTRNIAKDAGTSESGLFRVFDNKYNILMAVYNEAWGRVNDKIDEVLSAKNESDPRENIILIVKTLWEYYSEDPLTIAFIIMNTGNTDTLLVERKGNAYVTEENSKYIERIEKLSEFCTEKKLVSDILTSRSLCEGILGISEGVLLGWYLADKTKNQYAEKVSTDDAEQLLKLLLYGKL